MKKISTINDISRIAFVDKLYKELNKETKEAVASYKDSIKKAQVYLNDGLTESECAELLVIDGIKRESAEAYVKIASNESFEEESELSEYSFQFEDTQGRIWTSYDLGEDNNTIFASSKKDAWRKASKVIFEKQDFEAERLISIDKVW